MIDPFAQTIPRRGTPEDPIPADQLIDMFQRTFSILHAYDSEQLDDQGAVEAEPAKLKWSTSQ